MLRAVSTVCLESQVLELCLSPRHRRDVYKLFRTQQLWTSAPTAAEQTVLASSSVDKGGGRAIPPPPPPPPASPPPPPPPPRRAPSRAWTITAAALALTASVGGVYFYRKLNEEDERGEASGPPAASSETAAPAPDAAYPASGAQLPRHVQYLLIGGGTASFAAMRAIRSARPDAAVLIVGEEPHPPYMRPPLSKELWREPDLADLADDALARLSFRQWNGKRRPLAYEPLAFYTPVELLGERGGAGAARGWRVVRLDVARHEAELSAPGADPVTLTYERALLAPGARPRRLPELRAARDAGLVLALRGARDAARLARALHDPRRPVRRVVLVGGGFLASELSAALAERLGPAARVVQVFREEAPLARVLPPYLAAEAARRLRAAGVELVSARVDSGAPAPDGGATLRLAGGGELRADLVVECAGAEPETELARAAGLELHPELGGVVVNAELAARSDVWAAGDVACFYDAALGRRRLEHHDHAVVSGRLAGENMAGVAPPKPYSHQSMFWSDLGPSLGYEAIGVIDSRLPTVGVFSASAVATAGAETGVDEAPAPPAPAPPAPAPSAPTAEPEPEPERRFERGVVFYTREKRVVGVLLWNLFNRMHIARQVLAQGEFDDLFEVAKLFALHEED